MQVIFKVYNGMRLFFPFNVNVACEIITLWYT